MPFLRAVARPASTRSRSRWRSCGATHAITDTKRSRTGPEVSADGSRTLTSAT